MDTFTAWILLLLAACIGLAALVVNVNAVAHELVSLLVLRTRTRQR